VETVIDSIDAALAGKKDENRLIAYYQNNKR
jgi:hypothetical protein